MNINVPHQSNGKEKEQQIDDPPSFLHEEGAKILAKALAYLEQTRGEATVALHEGCLLYTSRCV